MEVTLEDAKNDLMNFIDELVFVKHVSEHNSKYYKDRIQMLFNACVISKPHYGPNVELPNGD